MPKRAKPQRRHQFFLNPYVDFRFTFCPKCRGSTRLRKFPFAILIEPNQLLALNMTGRYCPGCDLIIIHQDVLEDLLVRMFEPTHPEIVGNDYHVFGTVDRADWREGVQTQRSSAGFLDLVHEFKRVLSFEMKGGWMPPAERGG